MAPLAIPDLPNNSGPQPDALSHPGAIASFPRGLIQPKGCARFGMDSLLLAAFALNDFKNSSSAAFNPAYTIADIGCGCGIIGLAYILREPRAFCLGFDREPILIEAAENNAKLLGLHKRCSFKALDLNKLPLIKQQQNICLLTLANPPWRNPQEGRVSPHPLRAKALWATPDTLRTFCIAAKLLLAEEGRFYCILPYDQHPRLAHIFVCHGFTLYHCMAVSPYDDKKPARVLLAYGKMKTDKEPLLSSLVLHKHDAAGKIVWTGDALALCPDLGHNHDNCC